MTKGEITRQRLVSEAAKLFNQRGYEGSSMMDVMEATGLEKGGIYRHFSTKEKLALAAFDFAWHEASEVRNHDLDEVTDSVDKLKKFISNFVERRPAVPGGCPLLNTAVEADDGNRVLRQRALQALRGWQKRLSEVVSNGIANREIKADTDPAAVADLIISCLEGALMISRLERRADALHNAQAHLDTYLETAVRA